MGGVWEDPKGSKAETEGASGDLLCQKRTMVNERRYYLEQNIGD